MCGRLYPADARFCPSDGQGLYSVTGFASRGLTWASLAAETLASMLEAEPLPVESDIAEALDPARFVLRRLRRSKGI